jgi:4-hydroxy 2-oxovalerate aldolase
MTMMTTPKDDPPPSVRVMDVTLRDGSYLFNQHFSLETVQNIVSCLDAAGVSYVEIGHGVSIGARDKGFLGAGETDLAYAETARKAAKRAKIGMVAIPAFAAPDSLEPLRPFLDFVRIGTNVHAPREAEELIARAKKLGFEVFFQMIRTSKVKPKEAAETARFVESLGADVVYLVDSGGIWSPWEVKPYVEETLAAVKVPVGIHAHNHLGMALANTVAAVQAGCRCADASLRGAGRGAGNTQIELLNIHLERLGFSTGIDSEWLQVTAHNLEEELPAEKRGVAWEDLLPASLGLDIYPVSFFLNLCRSAGIDLRTLLHDIAAIPGVVEIHPDDIRKALEARGLDADLVFKRAGLKT